MALPATDTFTASSDAALQTYSANWTILAGGFAVNAAGDYVYPTGSGIESAAVWNSDLPAANQYAQAKLVGSGLAYDTQVGVLVRGGAGPSYYGLYYMTGGASPGGLIWLFKVVNGSWSVLAEANNVGNWNGGDVLRLEVNGTTLTPLRNGSLITALGTVTDSSIASGRVGLCAYNTEPAARLDNFEGGNLGVANPTVTVADSAALSEAVSVAISSIVANRSVAVSDAAIISESVVVRIASALSVSQAESVAVSESVAVVRGAAGALAIFVADSAAVSESLTARMGDLGISRSEAVTLSESAIAPPVGGANISGVLEVDPGNGRYFRRKGGSTVLLSGFHTWYEFQDGGLTYPPVAFDYNEWLDYLDARGVNLHKLWVMETARQWADADAYFAPLPYQRTGPGIAADGRPRFDLTQLNQEYFDRLYQRALLAGNRGHYVVVQLFQGWQVEPKGYGFTPFAYHPYNAGNNVNGIDGDLDNDGDGEETRNLANTAIIALQQAYIQKVLDTLNGLDNVLYEISNEDTTNSVAWQNHWIDYIHTYEAGKPKQHPVGFTVIFPNGNDADLTASNADWISPKNNNSLVPAVTAGSQVVLFDTDHLVGLTTEHKWVWQSFLQGHNPVFMDVYDGALYGADMRADSSHERIRYNLGAVLDYAARIDLSGSTPQGSLASTGYCLAKTAGVALILAYQPSSGSFTVNLSSISGVFNVEWLRTAATTPTVQAGGTVNGGAVRTLNPPWAGEDVLAFLWQSTYTVSVSDGATVSESVTVQVTAASSRVASVADAAALSELVALALNRTVAAGDAATLTEVVAAAISAGMASAADLAALSEAVVALLGLPPQAVGDAASVSESAAAAMGLPGVSVGDAANAAEAVNVAVQPAVTRSILVADAATVLDTPAAQLGLAPVAVSDAVTFSESTAVVVTVEGVIYISAAESVTVVDAPAVSLPGLRMSAADGVTVTEAAAATVASVNALSISVGEGVAVAEGATSAPLGLRPAAGEALLVGEAVAAFVAVSGVIYVNVSDAAVVLDAVQVRGPALVVGAADNVMLGEGANALVRSENMLSVSVAESVMVGEASFAAAALRGVAILETISVADWIVAYMVGSARADWTLSDSVLHKWILSNRSK